MNPGDFDKLIAAIGDVASAIQNQHPDRGTIILAVAATVGTLISAGMAVYAWRTSKRQAEIMDRQNDAAAFQFIMELLHSEEAIKARHHVFVDMHDVPDSSWKD